MYKPMLLLLLLLGVGCHPSTYPNKSYSSIQYVRAHLSLLASDEMDGREATKRGARMASDYIAAQLRLFGVLPFGDKGTYFQNFPMYIRSWSESSQLVLEKDGERGQLAMGTHFLPYTAGSSGGRMRDVIFVGHGITDSLYAWDDYAGLDVTGKVVVMFAGEPQRNGDSLFFNGSKTTKWSRSRIKRRLAQKKGAAGIVVLPDLKAARQFSRLKRWFLSEKFSLKKISEKEKSIPPAILADSILAKKILGTMGEPYAKLIKNSSSGKIKPGKKLNISLRIVINKKSHKANARNVVGIILGNDPQKENEYISVGAHYDHLGMRDTVVYNGADDNASGTTAILESARQVAALASSRRPVIYVFYTAEEKGLLGSTYFTNHFNGMKKVMANINMDMIGRGAPDSLYVIGSGRISSEYFTLVEKANHQSEKFGFNYLLDDENHPSNIYHRSDHWNFARHNIPIVFLFDYDMRDYHSPRDDFDRINISKVVRVARLTTRITLDVANLDHWLVRDKGEKN